MFSDWRKRRELQREYKRIVELYAPDFKAAKTEDDYYEARHIFDQETADITVRLEGMKTQKARNSAEKFGVEVPPIDEDGENWDEVAFTGRRFLSEKGLAKVNRQVNEARFTYWERWAKLLVPILSLVVAIIALLAKSG